MNNYVLVASKCVEEAMSWATTHCPELVAVGFDDISNKFQFVFESKDSEEFLLFALKYGSSQ